MTDEILDQSEVQRVDQAMNVCRQGDCFLGDHGFIELCRVRSGAGWENQWLDTPVVGLVLVSQSCDIARSCVDRPVVEMCPLVEVDQPSLALVVDGWRPRYAAVPSLSGQRLVADLDRTMTVEKAVVASWARAPGLRTDVEARTFALALSRKRARFAFPDDFNAYVEPLRRRLIEKHGRKSPEGEALRALLEIRVRAEPDWAVQRVQLTFYFVRRQSSPLTFADKPWHSWCDGWMKRLAEVGRFKDPYALITDYDGMSAADYLQSDQLDLEHLSGPVDPKA